jgi:hypothetical protein
MGLAFGYEVVFNFSSFRFPEHEAAHLKYLLPRELHLATPPAGSVSIEGKNRIE